MSEGIGRPRSARPPAVWLVAGTRPNFMKVAPVMRALSDRRADCDQRLVHTGQHYDANMSDVFFRDLGLPQPDHFLAVGSGTHARQTAEVMLRLEPLLAEARPDWVVVVGDVNSTLAAALVGAKLGLAVAHVEAGLRSGDRTMPEEVNRLLTDQLADRLYTPSRDADANLRREGIPAERIRFVGNVMIDSLERLRPQADQRWPALASALTLAERRFALVTLHRPSNVDSPAALAEILTALATLARSLPVVFPMHPRTRSRLGGHGVHGAGAGLRVLDPVGYLDFLALESHAALVLTDSGGVQEETTAFGVPCLTLRPNTERPITVTQGTNRVIGSRADDILSASAQALDAPPAPRPLPEGWDGHAAERIAADLMGESVDGPAGGAA